MTNQRSLRDEIRRRLSPLVYFSNNWLSRMGVVVVTAAVVFWIFLLPATLRGETEHPYVGILAFLLVPAAFFSGLALIPLGIYLRRRRGLDPAEFPPLDLRSPELRRLLALVGAATVANIIIASQLSYSAVNYMET